MHPHLISFIKAPVGYTLNALASLAMLAEPVPVVGRAADVDGAGGLVWPELTLTESDTPRGYAGPVKVEADELAKSDTPWGYADQDDDIDWDAMDAQIQAFIDGPAPLIVRGRAL